jgi:hypothetical protein
MSVATARKLADAVLLEGYVLYPYRASSTKNRFRWAFGVLAPRAWTEAGGCEPWWCETQLLVEKPARVRGLLRFLHAQRRTLESGQSWDEGQIREIALPDLIGRGAAEFTVPGGEGMLPLRGVVRAKVEDLGRALRISVRVENETPCADLDAPRDEALRSALVAAHLLLEAEGPGFLSAIDRPDWAPACTQTRLWPVLCGPPGSRDTLLAAPIILYDHAALAPESPGDLFDATEIDEILALRTLTLTDEEKREARATDPRARELLDRVDSMPPEVMSRLHGALRGLHQGEMVPEARRTMGKGARVRLRPGVRRTDAQDLLFAGRCATVEAVLRDEQDREVFAVTIDDDPAAELHRWYGRFHYYRPDEIEPL